MQVKAQGLLNAAAFIEERYGRDALADVLRGCGQPVRDTYTTAIAIHWHPLRELVQLVTVAAQRVGEPPLTLAREIGAAGARANMKGLILRIAFYYGRPEFMMKRAAGLWRQYNSQGTMELLEMTTTLARIEVRGVSEPDAIFCALIEGWIREVTAAMGVRDFQVAHSECRADGGARCLYQVRGHYDAAPVSRPDPSRTP